MRKPKIVKDEAFLEMERRIKTPLSDLELEAVQLVECKGAGNVWSTIYGLAQTYHEYPSHFQRSKVEKNIQLQIDRIRKLVEILEAHLAQFTAFAQATEDVDWINSAALFAQSLDFHRSFLARFSTPAMVIDDYDALSEFNDQYLHLKNGMQANIILQRYIHSRPLHTKLRTSI